MSRFGSALKHAWNVFSNQDPNRLVPYTTDYGASSGYRPDRARLRTSNERSIISSIYTRLGVDIASVDIRHARLDDQNRYVEDIDSGLNNCLTIEANLDQASRAFIQDIALTLFESGCVAVVPVDTSIGPETSGSFDILTLRVGIITQWYPRHVRVSLYNEDVGQRQEITLLKSSIAIIENPLYLVMNEPNSTLQRLIRKLNILDVIDEDLASKKLDLIIQLPYMIKSEIRRAQAEQRRTDIEFQLRSSQHGVAYTDGTEKVIQLNRPIENNLLSQVEFLTKMLYVQLGLTEEIMNGTADDKSTINYWDRTIEPVLSAITQEFKRKFLTKTARTQKQSVLFFKDPFRLVPIAQIAEVADKFTRNEIATSNEIRQLVGWKPHPDPKADQLVNSNMPQGDISSTGVTPQDQSQSDVQPDTAVMGSSFDQIDSAINDAFAGLSTSNGSG